MREGAFELASIVRPPPPEWNISKLARHFNVDRSVVRSWTEGAIPTLDQTVELERLLGIARGKWLKEREGAPQKKAKGTNGKKHGDNRRTG